jgi:prepilin-type N-terminal cleavage/methylation domain-containing protein
MKRKGFNKKGFTMIELITAIVIISIISVMAGMGLVQIANGYLLAKKSTVAAQQAQIALARLSKELSAIHTIDQALTTDKSLIYKHIGDTNWRKVAWTAVDQPLTLNTDGVNDDTLIDKVQVFRLTYHNSYSAAAAASYSGATEVIELTFQLKGYGDTPLIFVKRAAI